MDEKKVREAIEDIKKLSEWLREEGSIRGAEHCDTSIEALEKQLPKKPIEYEDKYYACPACGNVLMHKWGKYPTILEDKKNGLPCCLSCLQVIDWSE